YAGTSGRAAHLLVGMFHGVTGMVFDMGVADGADRCVAMCCGTKSFAAAVNGPAGGRIITRALQPLPFDLIQEWHIARTPYTCIGPVVQGESICHAITDASRGVMIGTTERHLFALQIDSGDLRVVGEAPGRGRLARGSEGGIFGLDVGDTLWRYDVAGGTLRRGAVALPAGSWHAAQPSWARDSATGALYAADAAGQLFRFTEESGFSAPLARTPHAPVGPMAVTADGRLFGFAGEGMARLFTFDPASATVADLGVAVSVFERRRYGYAFADAVVGRDGEIVFGEDDDLGHLWLYFPRIKHA
ncbi:hypothetical protein GX586_01365, partial [bacterium]|nr:hypothetical protein [bacterium]